VELLRWQWRLANRGVVTAVIDPKRGEMVSQAERVLSEAARGTKVEGHTVVVAAEKDGGGSERPPVEAVVTFDPRLPICILRVDGHEVTPSIWPVRERRAAPPPGRSSASWIVLVAIAVAVVGAGIYFVSRWQGAAARGGELGATHRARSGLFIAHFPEDLEAKAAVMPTGVDAIVLQDKAKSMVIVIAALPADPTLARDPWAIHQRLHDEALANLPSGVARFEASLRRDETCLGERGAAVAGSLKQTASTNARVWSCAFARGDSSYLVLTMVSESASNADQRRARAIVDATELTRLAELGTIPPH
jgi:hypothetical protein